MTEFIGKTIGNYRIEGLLGAGGMGQVFRARHIHLDRPAALKLLHGNLAQDPMFQTRFRQEAQAAAKLRHPHMSRCTTSMSMRVWRIW
jgi:Serine/threonine protein kinase